MSNYIESRENQRFKAWLKLLRHKYREKQGEYLIEGSNLIKDALGANAQIKEIIICYSDDKGYELSSYISKELSKAIANSRIEIFFLNEALFDKLRDTENGRNIIAVVEMNKFGDLDEVKDFQAKLSSYAMVGEAEPAEYAGALKERSNNIVVLDRLQDPGNIGAIIRTCDGAGFMAVLVMKGTADVYSPKVIRSAAGSLFRVPIIRVNDNAELMRIVDESRLSLVATGFDTDICYFEENLSGDMALVIGNEGGGISEEILYAADKIIKIPMYGAIDSLNAAVSAGVIMYESMRQRKQAEKSVR